MYEATVEVSREESSDGGVTFSFPVNLTVYGGRDLRTGDPTGAVLPVDEWCWTTRYFTADVAEADLLRRQAEGAYELRWDRTFFETYVRDRERALQAWLADNTDLAEGEEPTGPRPATPLPADSVQACPGVDTVIPDFTSAFDAAARFVESLTPVVPTIQPMQPDGSALAVTGNPAYLQRLDADGQPVPLVQSVPRTEVARLGIDLSGTQPTRPGTPIAGAVTFEASGTYAVDWGDGTAETGLDIVGVGLVQAQEDPLAPTVTHTWTGSEDLQVTVTDTWDVDITVEFLGDVYTFTFREDLVPWPDLDVAVVEVRSVRD